MVSLAISCDDGEGVAGGSGATHLASLRLTSENDGQGTFGRLTGVATGTFGELTCGVSGITSTTASLGLEEGSPASSGLEGGEMIGAEERSSAEELPPPPAMKDLK